MAIESMVINLFLFSFIHLIVTLAQRREKRFEEILDSGLFVKNPEESGET